MKKGKIEYVILTFLIEQEGPFYVSKCLELGVASFGDDEKEAYGNLADAVEVYLNTLEDLGTAREVLRDKLWVSPRWLEQASAGSFWYGY